MFANYERLIAEYKGADFNQRLNLYLQYPRLRSEFILIDQNEINSKTADKFNLGINSLKSQLNELLSSAASGFKKLVGVGSA